MNHPGRTRAADLRAVERLITAAVKWTAACENVAWQGARKGACSDAAYTKKEKAEAEFKTARDAARARFQVAPEDA